MPQKTLGSIIGVLCAVASLVQVSRRLRIGRRPTLVSRGRGFGVGEGLWSFLFVSSTKETGLGPLL
ncbi:unnamed protein product [Tetraodon nigroviridis]|uniref:(spotted green pufferfish) hypothetical protein n=1 Tax=Tetraodon nigroviridis TaxID=99883 RepID=Q4SJJ4_TETNG|nr:unnamed protein product [Tetraodon nigroviridis]